MTLTIGSFEYKITHHLAPKSGVSSDFLSPGPGWELTETRTLADGSEERVWRRYSGLSGQVARALYG